MSAGTLVNPFPQHHLLLFVSPIDKNSIPVYRPDRTIFAAVSEARLARLRDAGLIARVVRDRHSQAMRAILFASPADPTPPHPGTYQGTRYSYLEYQNNSPPCWQLRRLHEKHDFIRVIEDCLVP